jgi:NDP-sugar pyrophosphorylase family protein
MSRERITISIKSDILATLDKQIDGIKMRNRSHAIELLLSELLNVPKITTAVIMAGGKGAVRLIPIVKKSIKRLHDVGVNHIVIATGYLGEKIKQNIGEINFSNIKIEYIEGGEGTAGSLNLLKKQFKNSFFVVNLDQDFEINLADLANYQQTNNSKITIATNNKKTLKGIYIFGPEIFSFIPEGFSMLEEDVFPSLIKNNKVSFYRQ